MTGPDGRRTIGVYASLLAVALSAAAPVAAPAQAASAAPTSTIQLSIGGGAVDSAAYRWSSALAETLSRPPGLPDCDPTAPCGVPGVVAGAQTYDATQALVDALSQGKIATAVIPALSLFRLRCDGRVQAGPAISTLKVLYRQPLYLVVRGGTPAITRPADWAKATVAVGIPGSDSEILTLALLDAYRIPRAKVKLLRLSRGGQVDALRTGAANVGVFLGHVFDPQIGELIGKGFTLMTLPDTPERARLLETLPVFEASAIPPDAFPGLPPISNLAQPVVWAAGPALDAKLADSLVTALSEPHNQSRIAELVDTARPVPEGVAFSHLPAPLSEGARRFALSEHEAVDIVNCPSAAGQLAGAKQP